MIPVFNKKKSIVAVEDTARMFRVLADPTRLRMLYILLEEGELCVSDIKERANISMAGTSQQLRQLEESGIVKRVKDGRMVCYMPDYENSKAVLWYRFIEEIRKEKR